MSDDRTQVQKLADFAFACRDGGLPPHVADDVVNRIRGKKDTTVRLEIIPADAGVDGKHGQTRDREDGHEADDRGDQALAGALLGRHGLQLGGSIRSHG